MEGAAKEREGATLLPLGYPENFPFYSKGQNSETLVRKSATRTLLHEGKKEMKVG